MAAEMNTAWKDNAVQEFRDRLQTLDDLYFLRGQRALRNLRLWAAGRAAETPVVPPEHLDETQTSQENVNSSESIENTAE
jgi:hypothetical protein